MGILDKRDTKYVKGRSEEKPKEEEVQLALVDSLARTTLSYFEVHEICDRFASELKQLMVIDWAVIASIDKDKHTVHLSPLSSKISFTWDLGYKIVLPGTPLARVAESKCALVEPDLTQESRFWTGISWLKEGIRAVACMPLFFGGEVFGALIVGSRQPQAYGERELRLLRYAASQIAMPLQYSFLVEGNYREKERRVALSRLSQIIGSVVDMAELGVDFAKELRNHVPFDHFSIAFVEGEKVTSFVLCSVKEAEAPKVVSYPLKDTAVGWVIANRKAHVAHDFAIERQFPIDEVHLRNGLRTEIRVPLFSRGEVFATIHLCSLQPTVYQQREQEFLEQLATQIALPIENIRLRRQRSEEAKFVATLARKLRDSLTPVVAIAELLREESRKEPESRWAKLSQIAFQSAQAARVGLERLTNFIQIETSMPAIHREPSNIKAMLRKVAKQALPLAQSKKQLLGLELPQSVPSVEVNSQMLEQALSNLLESAIELSSEGSDITLHLREINSSVTIEVQWPGTPFSSEEQERLFQPYPLTELDKRPFPELALSLAITRQLVELCGGRVWAESKPGGNLFCISLPS